MTAGDGYRYLLNAVVAGDGDRDASSALTRYYLEAGTPPGIWLGAQLTKKMPDGLVRALLCLSLVPAGLKVIT